MCNVFLYIVALVKEVLDQIAKTSPLDISVVKMFNYFAKENFLQCFFL